jgi:peptide deformylase
MEKTELNIKIMGDPVLRKKARKVDAVSDKHRAALSAMARKMHDVRGIGLAAPQIGLNDALIVVDIGSGLYKFVNPRICEKEGEQTLEEGCLSVPGVYVKIKRAQRVVIEGLDEDARPQRVEAKDLLACVFQHEIDHLNGTLICDYVPAGKKAEIEKQIREYRKSNDHELPEQKRKFTGL